MNQLIVIAFDHFDDARNALKSLRTLEHGGRIKFEDTAIVERDPDGTAHVTNEVSGTTETAAVAGAIIGGLLLFAFPPAGIVLGAALGAAVGISFGTGVGGDFVNDVKETLRPGRSALFLVVRRSEADSLMAVLRPYQGDLLQTTLDSEGEEALRQALE